MAYTNEQIEKCNEIFKNIIKKQLEETLPPEDADALNRFRCWNCQCDDFYVESGFYICESCD